MSLTPGEIQSFTMALADACQLADLQLLVMFTATKAYEQYVPPSATGLLPWALVVKGASSDGWERQLLNKALELKPNNPKLRAFEEQYRSTVLPNPPDPCDATMLRANRLFIDRDYLRARLRDLRSSTAARVLKLQGAAQSGKSYSRYLVDHLAENGGGFRPVVIDLVKEEIDKPDQLASVIVTKIGGDEKQLLAQGETTVARWGLFLETAIRNEVLRRGAQVWLVFDGLSKDGLPTETLGVILNLAKRADDEPELRVILLDLPGELPPEIDRFLEEKIGAIDEGKCVTWLTTFLGLRGIAPAEADLMDAVAKMFGALPVSGDKDRLRMMANEIWRIASTQMTPEPHTAGPGEKT